MGNQHGVERAKILSDGGQAFDNLAAAEAGVDQDAGTAGSDKGGIPGAAGSENADL
jgi:hypothetical protein